MISIRYGRLKVRVENVACEDSPDIRGVVALIISDEKKFIFFHLTKAGGTSVNSALSEYYDHWPVMLQHIHSSGMALTREVPNNAHFVSGKNKGAHIDGLYMQHLYNINKKFYTELIGAYFTFTFSRNPYDWLYSIFLHRAHHGDIQGVTQSTEKQLFNEWAANDTIIHPSDRFDLTKICFIGRLESLKGHFRIICEKLDLNARLGEFNVRSTIRPGYRYLKQYRPESIQKVNKFYSREFELLRYPMLSPDTYMNHVDDVIDLPPIEN